MWNPHYGPMPMEYMPGPMEYMPGPMYPAGPDRPLQVVIGRPPGLVEGGMMYPVGHPLYNPSLQRSRPRAEERRGRSAGRHHRSPDRSRRSEPADPLNQWSSWRTGINEKLSKDLIRNTYREIPIGRDYDELVRPPSRSRHGIYHYSTAIDQATQLQKEDFVNFGIPRAQVRNNSRAANRDSSSSSSSSSSSNSDSEKQKPFYSIKKLTDRERFHDIQQHSNPAYGARYGYGGSEDRLVMNGRRERSRGHDRMPPDLERRRDRDREYR